MSVTTRTFLVAYYDFNSIYDIEREVSELVDEIPKNEDGYWDGKLEVMVRYIKPEKEKK